MGVPDVYGFTFFDQAGILPMKRMVAESWLIQTELMWERDRDQNGSLYNIMLNLHTATYVGI